MANKNIEFKATLNTSEMDSKIQALQQKLRTISSQTGVGDKAKSIYGESSAMSERAQKLQESFNQRNLGYLREEFNIRDRLYKAQESKMKAINDLMERAKKGSKEELDLLNDKVKTEEKLLRLQNEQNAVAEKYKNIKGTTEGLGAGTGGGAGQPPIGGGGAGSIGPTGGGGAGLLGALMKGFGGMRVAQMLVRGVAGTANFAGDLFQYPQERSAEQARIAQGAYKTSGAGDIMNGQGIRTTFFAQERMRAMQNAQTAQAAMNLKGIGSTVMDIGGSALQGAGTGAMIGAGIGSFVPGLGNVVGGVAGGVIGANIGAIGGLGRSLLSGQTGAGIKGALTGENPMEAIRRYRAEQFFSDYENNIKAEEAKDPFKQQALNKLEAMRPEMIRSQQLTGVSGNALFNEMQGGGLFTTQQKLGAIGATAGAGGSTYQTRNYEQSLNLQRGYGIQNAAGILGGLSQMTSKGGSDEAVKKILADAFSIGLNSSEFSRETEKFLAISTKFVVESGARSPEAMQKISAEMGSFVTGTSMADLKSAEQGRERFEQLTGAGGSQYSKALRLSKMRRELPNLNEADMNLLNNMSADQIKAGGPIIEAIATKSGLSVTDLQEKMTGRGGIQEFGLTYSSTQADNLKKIQEKKDAINEEKDPAKKAIMQKELLRSQEMLAVVGAGASQGTLVGDQYAMLSTASGMGSIGGKRDLSQAAPKQEESQFTEAEKAEARSNQIEIQAIGRYTEEYASSAKQMVEASAEVVIALNNLAVAFKSGDEEAKKKAVEAAVNATAGAKSKSNNVKSGNSASGNY
jgi:hypothetical protein